MSVKKFATKILKTREQMGEGGNGFSNKKTAILAARGFQKWIGVKDAQENLFPG